MSFSLRRGGENIVLSGGTPGSYPADEDLEVDDLAVDDYQDALLLNRQLRAMLAEQEVAQQSSAGGMSRRRPPRAPATNGGYSNVSNVMPSSCSAMPKENSGSINRRRFDEKVRQENAVIMQRRREGARSSSPTVSAGAAVASRESSQSVNRRRFQLKVQEENAGIITRLQRASSCNGAPGAACRNPGDPQLPRGWTRGVGGRAMPPPKLRWAGTKYDAGDWNS